MKFILVGDDDVLALVHAVEDFREIERAKTDLDRARTNESVLHDQRMIDQHGARRNQQCF